jgi:hypothetical protein
MNVFENIFNTEIKHWTGNDVVNALFGMEHDKGVYFADTVDGYHDWDKYPVNEFFSWRGSYDQPSISSDGNKVYTATELIVELNDFFESTQQGWKGGEFEMHSSSKLWCDQEGGFLGKGVSNVVECEEAIYIVIGMFR